MLTLLARRMPKRPHLSLAGGILILFIILFFVDQSRWNASQSRYYGQSDVRDPAMVGTGTPLQASIVNATSADLRTERENADIRQPHKKPPKYDFALCLKSGYGQHHKFVSQVNTWAAQVPRLLLISDFNDTITDKHGNTYQVHDVILSLANGFSNQGLPEIDSYYRSLTSLRSPTTRIQSSQEPSWIDKENKLGWKLDRFKNLPGLKLFYNTYPNATWYIMADDDTFLFLPNLQRLLEPLDHTKPYYLGQPTHGGNVKFAHGGSGIVLSQGAIKMFADADIPRLVRYYTVSTCCGDASIAYALDSLAGIRLNEALSNGLFKGGRMSEERWDDQKSLSKYVVGFHHIDPDLMNALHEYVVNVTHNKPFRAIDVLRYCIDNNVGTDS